jgi:hypothetical protein
MRPVSFLVAVALNACESLLRATPAPPAPDAAPAVTAPRGCAAFAANSPTATVRERRLLVDSLNYMPSGEAWIWIAEEPSTLVLSGTRDCTGSTIDRILRADRPGLHSSLCSVYGFVQLRCEAIGGVKRTIDLIRACTCASPTDGGSCLCRFE